MVLESTNPLFNNKTINYSQYLISKGWKIIGTRILTKKVNKKYINMVSFRFLSQFLTLAQPGETHPEKDVRPMTEKEAKCGSVTANVKLKS